MNNLTYGLVISFIGMGGTLLSLWLITVVVTLLKKLFPHRKEAEKSGKDLV